MNKQKQGGRWSTKQKFIVAFFFLLIVLSAEVEAAELAPEYQTYVRQVSECTGIDPYIMMALIETESGNNPDAVNQAGNCLGLCQIHKCWANKAAEQGIDIYDPYGNITWSALMLDGYYDMYGDWNKALVHYNAGRLYADSSKYSRHIVARAAELEDADERYAY